MGLKAEKTKMIIDDKSKELLYYHVSPHLQLQIKLYSDTQLK